MAMIYGVTVKGLKVFRDHEGAPCCQGNVYLNNKKLGFWSQDSWGGPDQIDFDSKLLQPAVDAYKAAGFVEDRYMDVFNAECLLGALADLMDMEKKFKSGIKRGYSTLVMNYFGSGFWSTCSAEKVMESKAYKDLVEKSHGEKVSIYTSLEDFQVA